MPSYMVKILSWVSISSEKCTLDINGLDFYYK
jgi:hypothetical protein